MNKELEFNIRDLEQIVNVEDTVIASEANARKPKRSLRFAIYISKLQMPKRLIPTLLFISSVI